MPWEEVTVNIHGDTAQQFVMPAGWRADYAEYLKGFEMSELLKDMPVVTVEQTVLFRQKAIEIEQQRDTAWAELREVRDAINADQEESTADEVRSLVAQRDKLLEALKLAMDHIGAGNDALTAYSKCVAILAEVEASNG